MLQLLLSPPKNEVDQLHTPVSRMTRRDRAARFCRGLSETSAAADHCNSLKTLRLDSDESSAPPVSASNRHVSILKNSATTSKPLMPRVDFIQNSGSQQRTADKDNELTSTAKNDNVSNCSVKHWLSNVDKLTKSSASNASPATAAAAVRLGHSLLRSSTSPDFIQHHLTSLVSVDCKRPQTLLTTSTMRRVEKFRRRAAAATTSLNDRGNSAVTSTDL